MNKFSIERVVLPTVLGLCALWSGPACASLGGDAAGVQADATAMQGAVGTTSLQQYDILEITNTSGMRVREFLNRDGMVFAVTWSGPTMPNLQRLLGAAHYAEYTHALAPLSHLGLRRSLRIALPTLVVESGGHARAYDGRAYLPTTIPAGVPVTDLQ